MKNANAPLPPNDAPEAVMPTPTRSEARAKAISKLLAEGWKGDDGKVRPIRSIEHAEFLAKCGELTLPA